jgi:sulfide:quinone oxidoreductase
MALPAVARSVDAMLHSTPVLGAQPVIQTAGLTKRYGATLALDRLDLTIEAGEIYGFLGPNGAGKTTTIRVLLGLHRATTGRAALFGLDAFDEPVAAHRRVAYVAGEPGLWPALTGDETLELLAGLHGGTDTHEPPARPTTHPTRKGGTPMQPHTQTSPPLKVIIAGGGVAGLESAFALHELAADHVAVTLIAPGEEFIYRPLSIGEPFSSSWAERYPLAPLAAAAGAELVHDTLASVDPAARTIHTGSGTEMSYDALILGLGASLRPYSDHATNVDDARMDELLHGLVQDIEGGYTKRLAIVIPGPMPWPFPAYELALMASERAWDMQSDLDVTVLTPERTPLEAFGATASQAVAKLLSDRRIEVVTSAYCEVPRTGLVVVHPGGRTVAADRVVAFPQLVGPEVSDLPSDGGGFIPVDEYGRVRGVDRVWAAGDGTDYPVKQGGVAAQLADTAAQSIAALAGVPMDVRPFAPVVEGVLMTGGTARYLRATPGGPEGDGESVFAELRQGARPPKIAARYLGPHLSGRVSAGIGSVT